VRENSSGPGDGQITQTRSKRYFEVPGSKGILLKGKKSGYLLEALALDEERRSREK
jgi:hypothetical protein